MLIFDEAAWKRRKEQEDNAQKFHRWMERNTKDRRKRCVGQHPIGDCWPWGKDVALAEMRKAGIATATMRIVNSGGHWTLIREDSP